MTPFGRSHRYEPFSLRLFACLAFAPPWLRLGFEPRRTTGIFSIVSAPSQCPEAFLPYAISFFLQVLSLDSETLSMRAAAVPRAYVSSPSFSTPPVCRSPKSRAGYSLPSPG